MGSDCRTEEELEKALTEKSNGSVRFIEAHTDRWDGSPCAFTACCRLRLMCCRYSSEGRRAGDGEEEPYQGMMCSRTSTEAELCKYKTDRL